MGPGHEALSLAFPWGCVYIAAAPSQVLPAASGRSSSSSYGQLTTGGGRGEESSSRCLLTPCLRKPAPPAPPCSTASRFELAIWGRACPPGLGRAGQRGSVAWPRTGCRSSQPAPPGASSTWVVVPGEQSLPALYLLPRNEAPVRATLGQLHSFRAATVSCSSSALGLV